MLPFLLSLFILILFSFDMSPSYCLGISNLLAQPDILETVIHCAQSHEMISDQYCSIGEEKSSNQKFQTQAYNLISIFINF